MKYLLRIIIIAVVIINSQLLIVNGQAPEAISYQAVARDASGNLIANQSISLRLSLHNGTPGGTVVYQETQSATTSTLGLIEIKFGTGLPTTGVFHSVVWDTGDKFLQVEMDATGSGVYTDMGTQQMLSVPYALYAKIAGSTPGAVVFKGTWNASTNSPSLTGSVGSKGDYYEVSVAGNTSLNGITDWGTGDWAIFNGTVWQKVDNSEAPVSSDGVSFTPNGDITSTNAQDAIVEVRDDTDAKLSAKANTVSGTANNFAKLNGSGQLVDSQLSPNDFLDKGNTVPYSPASDYNPATKKYVDDQDASIQTQNNTKADKVTTANPTGHIAALDATGNLADGGEKAASNISFTPSPDLSSTNVQDAVEEVNGQFADLIDSYIHRTDDGVYIYEPIPGEKRFGIGITTPAAPLGIKADASGALISLTNNDGTQDLMLRFRAATPGTIENCLSIEDPSSGTPVSRFFIQDSTGNIGIGTTQPTEMLHLQSSVLDDRYLLGLKMYNSASTANQGWSLGHVHDALDAAKDGSFSIREQDPSFPNILRFTILPGGNTGINEPLPDTKLHVSRPVADPAAALDLAAGTGIVTIGPMTNNVVADYRGIQARTGAYVGTALNLSVSTLHLQNLGGAILIHGKSSSPDVGKVIVTEDGKLGLGTITPTAKLEINDSVPGGIAGLKIKNSSVPFNHDWSVGVDNVSAGGGGDGALKISFDPPAAGQLAPPLTVLLNGNVGINEAMPNAPLGINRLNSDPQAAVSLISGSGIVVIGSTVNTGSDSLNIAMDSHSLQARVCPSDGSGWLPVQFNLQPLGGDIIVHNNMPLSQRIVVTGSGLIGIGKTPAERLDINGAVTFGDTSTPTPAEGTVRWHGTGTSADLEVFKGGAWVSLTSGSFTDGFVSAGTNMITYNPSVNAKVGIGIAVPTEALEVNGTIKGSGKFQIEVSGSTSGESVAGTITNQSSTSSSTADNRIGLQVSNTGSWSSNSLSKDIGIYISNVSGQSNHESNIAAVLHGNTVIGDVTSSSMVGSNGTNVLAIQTGISVPTTPFGGVGVSNGGFQIYSETNTLGVSEFHLMNGDGSVIKLFRAPAITAPNTSPVGSSYGTTEQGIIQNMRDRIDALEVRLQALGLLL